MALTRSEQMARIRGRDTGPERLLHRAMLNRGVACSFHERVLGARPDLVLLDQRLVVFVDGCFWHGCPEHYVRPRSREAYWAERLRSNVERDRRQTLALEGAGWRVLRFWEHEVFEATEAVVECALSDRVEVTPAWRLAAVALVDPETDLERQSLVDLRDPLRVEERLRVRSTRKWARRRPSPPAPK